MQFLHNGAGVHISVSGKRDTLIQLFLISIWSAKDTEKDFLQIFMSFRIPQT